ncbi:MAG: hypothetical protein LAO06_17715 [Acidobacteriia bacterium]|nr:hypothetical protein [Terriglobia bacterium]
MACQELEQLRKEATKLKGQIDEQVKKARAKTAHTRQGRPSGKSEYVPFLQRRLTRLAENIERHIAKHRCQE